MSRPENINPYQAFLQENSIYLQGQLARSTFGHMRDAYHNYAGKLADPQTPPEVLAFTKTMTIQQLQTQTRIFGAGASGINSVAGGYSQESDVFINTCSRAYRLLVTQENPDNWLLDFLEQYPLFAQDIGGIPPWLQRQPPE